MDAGIIKMRAGEFLKKYRFVLLVLAAGLFLMAMPQSSGSEPTQAPQQKEEEETMEESLANILSRIKGAGKVEVLLTQYRGSETLYQTDSQESMDTLRSDTVILSDSEREESGLIRQVNPPVYLGALIVCQGADVPSVKLAIVEAVMDVTGLSSNKITVLKMK